MSAGALLFSDGAWEQRLRLASRPPREVFGHRIENHGREHQNRTDPDEGFT
jgi:hypothetical protein